MATSNIKTYLKETDFAEHIKQNREPAILRKYDIGACVSKWQNSDYLKSKLTGKKAKIHIVDKNQVDKMDFKSKNFKYGTIDMTELIEKVFENENDEMSYYLRWIGNDPRGQEKANFDQDFPQLSEDFKLKEDLFFPQNHYFSSVLRISSPGIRVWTHYDVMDNVYVQIRGQKNVIMWNPNEAFNLYLDGDKSKVVDLQDQEALNEKYPKFLQADKQIETLEPGDLLFIPALWFHNMKAIGAGIAINVFWKNLDDKFYDKKDPYGNKDLVPAAKAMRMLDNVWHQLDDLPEQYRDFYARQLISRLESKCISKKDITE